MTTVGAEALSAREAEVLAAVGEHLTNAEIAQRLHISVRTVESHVSALLRKLGVGDRRQLAALAPDVAAPGVAEAEVVGLPSTWTSFVGRTSAVAAVADALGSDRLVTLVGPGGIGKTRLATVAAQSVARTFPGGGAFVDLVPVGPDLLVQAAAAALGVVERPREPLERLVHERLRRGRTLLVLDNCEHVLEAAAAFVHGLLTACPEAVVLATSRERLGLAGERLVPVPPLELPGDAAGRGSSPSEAERLFLDRASLASGGPADPALVAEVCRRLEGVPLAIELAAARSGSLGLEGLLSGFADRLRLLGGGGGADARHRSLRAVIDWSHDLLAEEERVAFRRLAVFRGAFDLEAAAAVATDDDASLATDVVGRLADKSLLVHSRDGASSRWRMLETVHAYAHEQLAAAGDRADVERRHLAWARGTAAHLLAAVTSGGPWQRAYDPVADDLRAALAFAAAAAGAGEDAAARTAGFELAGALGRLAYARHFLAEAREHFALAIELAPDEREAVRALRVAAAALWSEMRGDRAYAVLLEAAERALADGDPATAAIALADAATFGGRAPATFDVPPTHEALLAIIARARELAPPEDLEVRARLAVAAAWSGREEPTLTDPALSAEALELARRLDDPVLISDALDASACAEGAAGRFKRAAERTGERLALLDRLPRHDPMVGGEVADIFHMATESALAVGDLAGALDAAHRHRADGSHKGLAHFPASHMIVPYALMGAFDDALVQAAVSLDGWERTGRPSAGWMAPGFYAAALVHGLRGDDAAYAEWLGHGEAICLRSSPNSFARFVRPRVALHRGEVAEALGLCVPSRLRDGGFYEAYAIGMRAEVAAVAGAPDAEALLDAAALAAAENDFAAAQVLRARARLHGDDAGLRQAVGAWEALGARFERACTLLLLADRRSEGAAELAALGCAPPAA